MRILRITPNDPTSALLHALVRGHLPEAELHVADDGIAGIALAGRLEPDLLLVDLMLPGIEGRQLVASLHSNPQFRRIRVAVVTDLDTEQRSACASVLTSVTVLHWSRLAEELPHLLASLPRTRSPGRSWPGPEGPRPEKARGRSGTPEPGAGNSPVVEMAGHPPPPASIPNLPAAGFRRTLGAPIAPSVRPQSAWGRGGTRPSARRYR